MKSAVFLAAIVLTLGTQAANARPAENPVKRVFAFWDVSNPQGIQRPQRGAWTAMIEGWRIPRQRITIPSNSNGAQAINMIPFDGAGETTTVLINFTRFTENFKPQESKFSKYMCAYLDSERSNVNPRGLPIISVVSQISATNGIRRGERSPRPLFFASPDDCRTINRNTLPTDMPTGPNRLQSWR